MTKIITVHAFRNGVGRSTLIVNLVTLLAARGLRVGVVEANLHMPSLRILFALKDEIGKHSFRAYLCGECPLEQAIYRITPSIGKSLSGEVFLIPANSSPSAMPPELSCYSDVESLRLGLTEVAQTHQLDLLFIDPPAGLPRDALECVGAAHIGLLLMRPDRQDYQGTGFLLDIFRKLDALQTLLLVNDAPTQLDFRQIRADLQQQYQYPVTAVVPHSQEMMAFKSKNIFVLQYPNAPLTKLYQQLINMLLV